MADNRFSIISSTFCSKVSIEGAMDVSPVVVGVVDWVRVFVVVEVCWVLGVAEGVGLCGFKTNW